MQSDKEKRDFSDRIRRILNYLAAIAAIVAIPISIYLGLIQEKNKDVSVTLSEPVPLLRSESVFKSLFLSIKGKQIKQAWLQTITYRNNGDLPIKKSDIEDSITIIFDENVKILTFNVRSTNPNNLNVTIGKGDSFISINHGLLNTNDYVILDLFLESISKSLPACHMRIAGIESCEVLRIPKKTAHIRRVALEMNTAIDQGQLMVWAIISIIFVMFSTSLVFIEILNFIRFRIKFTSSINQSSIKNLIKEYVRDIGDTSNKSLFSENTSKQLSLKNYRNNYNELIIDYTNYISEELSLSKSVDLNKLMLEQGFPEIHKTIKRKTTIEKKWLEVVKSFIEEKRKISWYEVGGMAALLFLSLSLVNVMVGAVTNVGIEGIESDIFDWLRVLF